MTDSNGFAAVLALATLPALGNFLGGILSELLPVSQRNLSLSLHAAAGIVLAVVGIELMPRALEGTDHAWLVLVFFVLGGVFFMLVDRGIGLTQELTGHARASGSAWAIYFGVSVDLFSDGLMIGAGSTLSLSLALLLALGQTPADIPEGFATIATFKRYGIARRQRLLLAASFVFPIFLGTVIGYFGMQGQPDLMKYSLLSFTGGILLTIVVEEMIGEAHEGEEPRAGVLMLVGGFALFGLVSTYLG